jgi:hypothetical protein
MTLVLFYAFSPSASSNPDGVDCVVPWRVDEKLDFFGPCKIRLRALLRKMFLRPDLSYAKVPADIDILIVAVNGSNQSKVRKIVYAGRLSEVMTNQEADKRLQGGRFRKMRGDQLSPLHVEPVEEGGKLVGYKHVSKEHAYREEGKPHDKWVYDLVSDPEGFEITPKEGPERMILRRAPTQDFDRDCCMLLENRFFAQGRGIEIDGEALEILRKAQPGKEIDGYAVFGWSVKKQANGQKQANGLRGAYLPIGGALADRFVRWLNNRSCAATEQLRERARPARGGCALRPPCGSSC